MPSRRGADEADAVFCALCAGELTRQTKLGRFSKLADAASVAAVADVAAEPLRGASRTEVERRRGR
jgi:hypothetical protein